MYNLPAGELVKRFAMIGDTSGSEAGTRTKVTAFFNNAHIKMIEQ